MLIVYFCNISKCLKNENIYVELKDSDELRCNDATHANHDDVRLKVLIIVLCKTVLLCIIYCCIFTFFIAP